MYHGYIAEQYIKSLLSIGPEGAKEATIKRWSMDWKVGEHTDSGKPFLEQAAEIRESFNPKESSASKFVPWFLNLEETLSGEDRLFYTLHWIRSGRTLLGQTLAADCAAQGIGVTWGLASIARNKSSGVSITFMPAVITVHALILSWLRAGIPKEHRASQDDFGMIWISCAMTCSLCSTGLGRLT